MIVVMVLVNITVMVIMMLVIILTVMIIMMTIIILMMRIIGMEMITNTWLFNETAFHRPSGEEGGGALYHGWENTVMEEYLHPCPSSGRFNHIDFDVNIDVSIFCC